MRITRRPFSLLSLAAVAALTLAGCRDNGPGNGGLPTDAGAGLYPAINVSGSKGTAQVDLSLRQVPGGLKFGSFQGELAFDPHVLTFQTAAFPQGVDGVANEAQPGHIRFVASALDGATGLPLVTLRFSTHGAVTRESFAVTFEEVTDGDFTDLTAQVKPDGLIYQSH
jgi:hypothetical protein